jgi:hypothetical protein
MLLKLWRAQPVVWATRIAAVIVFVCAKAGVVIDTQSLVSALVIVVPILLSGHVARREVIPVHSLVTDHTLLPPDPVNKPPVAPRKRGSA